MMIERAYKMLAELRAQPLSMTKSDLEFMESISDTIDNERGLTIKQLENIARIHQDYV